MKFAHLADCHIGSWRDQKLREISLQAFVKAINECIKQNVDFVVISGDLFHTALPAIDNLKSVVEKLKELKDRGIPVYGVAGSHDYSASGKTMIDVLERAGLFINVFKGKVEAEQLNLMFTVDSKTGAKLTGIKGKKGMLDRKYYERLNKRNIEAEQGFKIFLFHTAIDELKPKELEKIESAPLSYLPKGFDYYAGGHVHYIFETEKPGYKKIVYPGPLFPNNFLELEKLKNGGFYLVEYRENKLTTKYVPIEIIKTDSYCFNVNNKTPELVEKEILDSVKNTKNKIILMRIEGILKTGKTSDINFKKIFDAYKDAYIILKNTSKLESREQEEIEIKQGSIEEIENSIIDDLKLDKDLVAKLIRILDIEKEEGEKSLDFENRIIKNLNEVIKI